MYEVVDRYVSSYGEDMPRGYQDVYVTTVLTLEDAELYIDRHDPYCERNLVAIDIGDPE